MPPKRNAFFNFMVKRRSELEGQGRKFPGGWREVSVLISEEWAKMSLEDKKPFMPGKEIRSVSSTSVVDDEWERSERTGDDVKGECNSEERPERPSHDELTRPLDQVLMNAIKQGKDYFFSGHSGNNSNTYGGRTQKQIVLHRKIACFDYFLENQITRYLHSVDSLVDMPIILISCNTWCKTNMNQYVPSEIALISFCVRTGVIDQFCVPVDPGAFPAGYGYVAKKEADKLFFPLPPFDQEFRNYDIILEKILLFIDKHNCSNNRAGFLYCLRHEMRMVYGCLQWLLGKTGGDHEFELFPFEFLVLKLSKYATATAVVGTQGKTDLCSLPGELDSAISGSRKSKFGTEAYFGSVSSGSYTPSYNTDDDISYMGTTISRLSVSQSSATTVKQRPRDAREDEDNCFNSEQAVLMFIDRLMFGSLEFFGCLHHMFFSDVVHLCALNRLNRYTFQTLDLLLLNFGILPVNGINFIDTETPNLDEMDKRKEMLENWGVRFKLYPGYITPPEREAKRAAEIARLNALEREEGYYYEFDEGDPGQIPLMFRPKAPLPEFLPSDPEYKNITVPPNTSSLNSSSVCSIRSFDVDLESFSGSGSTNINTNDELYSGTEEEYDDGWTFKEII